MTKNGSNTKYMAIDQYGNTYHGLKYPRQELAEIFGVHQSTPEIWYEDGTNIQIGYKITRKNVQLRLYEVNPVRVEIKPRGMRKVG